MKPEEAKWHQVVIEEEHHPEFKEMKITRFNLLLKGFKVVAVRLTSEKFNRLKSMAHDSTQMHTDRRGLCVCSVPYTIDENADDFEFVVEEPDETD